MKRATAGALVLGVALASSLSAHDRTHERRLPLPQLGSRAACVAYSGLPPGFGHDERAGMVYIEGGSFVPGSNEGYAEERPADGARTVHVPGFWIDRTEVTNAQFAAFVAATGYVTLAEREGASAVFRVPSARELAERALPWWQRVAGANFRHPRGPEDDLRGSENHPVVHIAYEDALAYAKWLGRTLPTEEQWEYAARAGRTGAALHGAPRDPQGRATANFWQGDFPTENRAEDGFAGTAPVGCYPPNPWGLHDMIGNVWEWTRDDYRLRSEQAPAHEHGAGSPSCEAGGAAQPKVIKGGSFLCAANYCARYRVSARHPHEPATTTNHLGFRTVSAP